MRERVIQTLYFEGIGLLLVAPLYAAAAGAGMRESFAMVAVVSLVVMTWSAFFNAAFDTIEWRWTGRIASDRPHRLRSLHALLHELTAMVVSCPVIFAMTPLSWGQALLADLGLTLAYAAYAYVFHLGYDRLRPVMPAEHTAREQRTKSCRGTSCALKKKNPSRASDLGFFLRRPVKAWNALTCG